MDVRKIINNVCKIAFPLILGGAILGWMYRGFDWGQLTDALKGEMNWTWMLLSLPFGVLAQVFRALRWRQVLQPMGYRPRVGVCMNSIFLSYASSLVVPRVGEVLRCGVLRRYEGISFARSVGTVLSERVVDTMMVLLIALLTFLMQIPVFSDFFEQTGVSMSSFVQRFTAVGYAVTALCLLVAALSLFFLFRRLSLFSRAKDVFKELMDGLLSLRDVQNLPLFLIYSLGIWVAYYLHFYLTFGCFEFTEALGWQPALVAFVVGCFAVLVPTPNGAGPWHFAVKTVLVLYGVSATDGVLFVLVVHTLQTLLVVFLGLYAVVALQCTKPMNQSKDDDQTMMQR